MLARNLSLFLLPSTRFMEIKKLRVARGRSKAATVPIQPFPSLRKLCPRKSFQTLFQKRIVAGRKMFAEEDPERSENFHGELSKNPPPPCLRENNTSIRRF